MRNELIHAVRYTVWDICKRRARVFNLDSAGHFQFEWMLSAREENKLEKLHEINLWANICGGMLISSGSSARIK